MPVGVAEVASPLLIARALRGFADGYVVVLLPAYLLALGFDQLYVGYLSTAPLRARPWRQWQSGQSAIDGQAADCCCSLPC